MAGKVLVHGFVRAAMESEIVFIILETGEGAKEPFCAGDFIYAGLDVEVAHLLHFAGAELGYFGGRDRSRESGEWDGCHD